MSIKELLKQSFLYKILNNYRKAKLKKSIIVDWEKNGRPSPPPHVYKAFIIKSYRDHFKIKNLIETGTYRGDMIRECISVFKRIISIELDEKLYQRAINTFDPKPNVKIYQGDSGELMDKILENVNERCLFWLDGHYSEGITAKGELNTPILKELEHIFKHPIKNHVILIDDARAFNGSNDYPNIIELEMFVKTNSFYAQFVVENDIIRIF